MFLHNGETFLGVHSTKSLQIWVSTLQYPTEVRALKNQRVTIMMSQEYRTVIEEKAKVAGLIFQPMSAIALTNTTKHPIQTLQIRAFILPTSYNQNWRLGTNNWTPKDDQIVAKDQRIEKLQQALDQQQQLHAVSQNTFEAQRLQSEEAKHPRPLLVRLKAVFVPD